MNRRRFLQAAGLTAAGFLSGCSITSSNTFQSDTKPNFLFILIDDLGWADLPCYGNRFHETPHIDRLAKESMRFTDAYAACPVCSPTRASIYSGQYPARIGLTDFIPGHWRPYEKVTVPVNDPQYLPPETVTIAEALESQGYISSAYGKWHCGFGAEHHPNRQGFDDAVEINGPHFGPGSKPNLNLTKEDYFAEVVTQLGEKFLEANRNKPFCLFINHFAVHIPLQARQELIAKYENKPKPDTGINNPVYAAMMEHVDRSVGRMLDKLDELGLKENTVVVFFSDNGGLRQMYTGEGPIVTTNSPLRDEKGTVFEGGIRVPLLIRLPGVVKPGSVCREPVTSVDFYPTFLQMAGVEKPAGQVLDGESIVGLLRGQKSLKRDAIYWHYPHYHHSVPAGAVRSGDWKLIEFYDDRHVELYHLKQDIGEQHDLSKDQQELAEKLQKKLAAWRTSVGAKMPVPNPDFDPAKRKEWGTHPDRDEIVKAIRGN